MPDPRPSSTAVGLAPLVLRLVLGLTFVWAGAAKWWGTMPVSGSDAAFLANLGVLDRPSTVAAPASTPPMNPLPAPPKQHSGGDSGGILTLAQAGSPAPASATPPVTAAPPLLTAEDFPDPVPCRGMWMIALAVHKASHPLAPAPALWPRSMGEGLWPKVIAMLVFAAEFGGGGLVLLGFFTRTSAFSIAAVMLGALWLTQIGPATHAPGSLLGFLPAKDWLDVQRCQLLLWQSALLAIALALMLLGSGALAIDRAVFGYRVARGSTRSGGASAR